MDKANKNDVNYRKGEGSDACANCESFLPPDECVKVNGVVSGAMVCNLFMPTGEVQESGINAEELEGMLYGG